MRLIISRQMKELYDYIARFTQEKGYCPSFREMQIFMGFKSNGGVVLLLKKMEKAGLIRKFPNKARSIEIIPIHPHDNSPRIVEKLPGKGRYYRITEKGSAYINFIKEKAE